MPTCSPAAPVPPTFRQPPSGPQDAIVVRAGDRAVLSCETDSLPEPTVTWHKDGQPLGLAQRTQTLLGGQRLEIRDTQVSSPWHGRPWVAVGPGPGEPGQLCGRTWGLLPPRPTGPHTESISSLQGESHEKSAGLQPGSDLTLSKSIPHHLPPSSWDLDSPGPSGYDSLGVCSAHPPWCGLDTHKCLLAAYGLLLWETVPGSSLLAQRHPHSEGLFPPGLAGLQAQERVGVWNLAHSPPNCPPAS